MKTKIIGDFQICISVPLRSLIFPKILPFVSIYFCKSLYFGNFTGINFRKYFKKKKKSLRKEGKCCWNCHLESLILYVNVIQFYRLYMHWRILIKSWRTEIVYYIFCETAFSRYFAKLLVICPGLKLFITTQCCGCQMG